MNPSFQVLSLSHQNQLLITITNQAGDMSLHNWIAELIEAYLANQDKDVSGVRMS